MTVSCVCATCVHYTRHPEIDLEYSAGSSLHRLSANLRLLRVAHARYLLLASRESQPSSSFLLFCSIFLICRAVSELSIPCLTANRIIKYPITTNTSKRISENNDPTADALPILPTPSTTSINSMIHLLHSPYQSCF